VVVRTAHTRRGHPDLDLARLRRVELELLQAEVVDVPQDRLGPPLALAPVAPAPTQVAAVDAPPLPAPPVLAAVEVAEEFAAPAPVEVAEIEPMAPPPPPPRIIQAKAPGSVTVALPAARPVVKTAEAAAPKASAKKAASKARPALSVAAAPVPTSLVRRASAGKSGAVVQLGAYSTRERVESAWAKAVSRHSSLRSLTPMTARFNAPQGSVYRLSVRGFGSERDALRLCQSLKSSGGTCFVRRAAGDAPVSFGSL